MKKKSYLIDRAIHAFFRYQMVSFLTLLNRKEDYINSLRANKKDLIGNPLKSN